VSAAACAARFASDRVAAPGCAIRGTIRAVALLGIWLLAIVDVALVRLMTEPTGARLAHARATWLHRWSRIARRALGLRLEVRGFSPVSGIVVANHSGLIDALLLAAVRPCVFVAGAEVACWPFVGLIARLGGTLFVDRRRRRDVVRVNFMIQRAVQRRLLVVVFPGCGSSDGSTLRTFTSALFQPAAELGCTLTASAIDCRAEDGRAPLFAQETDFVSQLAHLITRTRAHASIAFSSPAFRRGDRKHLARLLRSEVLALKLRRAQPPG